MKIAFLSDVHGNLPALQAVLADAHRRGAEKVVAAGDLVGFGPFPNETVALLVQQNILSVKGNYDEAVANDLPACGCDFASERAEILGRQALKWAQENTSFETKKYLQNLPAVFRFEAGGYQLAVVHGSPWQLNEPLGEDTPAQTFEQALRELEADILIAGHTHRPFYRRVGRQHFLNAGSAGRPQAGLPDAGYLLLTIDPGRELQISFISLNYDRHLLITWFEQHPELAELAKEYRS